MAGMTVRGAMARIGAARPAYALALLTLCAACKEEPRAEAPDLAYEAAVKRAAEAQLRTTAGTEVALRGVQVYRQAAAETAAVCGQVNLRKGTPGAAFTLFVAVVTPQTPGTPNGPLKSEQHVATSDTTASRVFVETLLRCYEGGGPPPQQRAGAPPLMAPVPESLPSQAQTQAAPQAAPQAPPQAAGQTPPATAPGNARAPGAMTPATVQAPAAAAAPGAPRAEQGRVTMQQNGNLRVHPNGGGAVVRVIGQGSSLQVFDEAAGGWLQVGDGEPWGWVHRSMVNR